MKGFREWLEADKYNKLSFILSILSMAISIISIVLVL